MQTHYLTVVYTEETSSQDRSSLQLSVFEGWLVYVDSLVSSFVHRGNQLIGRVIFVLVCVKGGWFMYGNQLIGQVISVLVCVKCGWFMQTLSWTVLYTEETSLQDRSSLQLSAFEGWLVYVDSLLDCCVHRGNQLKGHVIFVVICVKGGWFMYGHQLIGQVIFVVICV